MTEITNETVVGNNEAMTPEQVIQLEEAKAERAKAEARSAELEVERGRLDASNVQLRYESNFADACRESGADFYLSAKQIRTLLDGTPDASGISVSAGADGRVLCEKDGKRIAVKDALREYAVSHPEMARGATALLLDAGLVRSRDQFRSDAEKSAFIAKHGARVYEQLPLHAASKVDVSRITAAAWRALPPEKKVALIAAGARVDTIMARR